MGTPYLNSGESIILTTHRVSVDAVPYDIMLTTERLFLIDNRNIRFEPRIIALSTLLSVQGGKTPALEPVITLLFHNERTGEARAPVNLVFSQNPHENRKPERDDWVRSLIQLTINQHERESVPERPAVAEMTRGTGLRPATRHGVAPEMVRPLSNVVDRQKEPAPVTIIPEEVEGSGEIPVKTAAAMPLREESPVPEKPSIASFPIRGILPPATIHPARVIIPQIIEELLPEKKIPVLPEEQETGPAVAYDPEVLFRAIPTAVRSTTVTEEQVSLHPATDETAAQEPDLPVAGPAEQREIPDIIRALRTGSVEPVTAKPDETITTAIAPEPAPDNTEAAREEIHDSPAGTVPATMTEEPASQSTPEVKREPAPAIDIPIRHPIPPAREIRPMATTLAYGLILLLVIALVAAGAVLLSGGPAQTDMPPATPTPTIVQVTTLPPGTVQPVTPTPVTIIPSSRPPTSRPATPLPAPPAASIPQTGVFVRVICTAEYFGTLGNTGMMRQVSGTGDTLYPILRDNHPVQVSIQKKDNSGAMLTATIYRNGTQIATRSVTSPMGTVDLLIDPVTARAPGLSESDTTSGNTATATGLENY